MPTRHVRKRKLIKPGLQLRMTAVFVGVVTLLLMLQFALLTSQLHQAANALPNDSAVLLSETNRITVKLILVSAGVFLPLTALVGILATFRIAGPIYRIERYLRQLAAGERPAAIQLRKHDELQDFARLLNDATVAARGDGDASLEFPLREAASQDQNAA